MDATSFVTLLRLAAKFTRLRQVRRSDEKLIVLSETGELLVVTASPKGFEALARAQVVGKKCWTVPVLANARIYVRNVPGDLLAVDVSGT